ncbi:MAG: hypothetical protein K2X69_11300, partial [Silvanigrellaceae bacterium]|nr:hypothetical protein [Silvanigrellaceae bacterium]
MASTDQNHSNYSCKKRRARATEVNLLSLCTEVFENYHPSPSDDCVVDPSSSESTADTNSYNTDKICLSNSASCSYINVNENNEDLNSCMLDTFFDAFDFLPSSITNLDQEYCNEKKDSVRNNKPFQDEEFFNFYTENENDNHKSY